MTKQKMIFVLAIAAAFMWTACQSTHQPSDYREPSAFTGPKPGHKPKPVKPPFAPANGGSSISFDFMHTKPNCQVPFPEMGEGKFHKPTYCEGTSQKQVAADSGMEKRIVEMLDTTMKDPKNSKVFVAYFSFSNKVVQQKICDLSAAGVSVRAFLDNGSVGTIDNIIMNNVKCLDANKKLNVKLSYLGGNTTVNSETGSAGFWQLHHNKFMYIDSGLNLVKINFSSGNLSSFGTSLHLDHWVMLEAPKTSNITNSHICVMAGLEAADALAKKMTNDGTTEEKTTFDQRKVSNAYIDEREKCFVAKNVYPRVGGEKVSEEVEDMLKAEEIAPVFSPNNDDAVADAFLDTIDDLKSGEYLYIAIQHFLHSEIKNAILRAAKRGVEIKIVMDDDALRGESEVPGVDKLILDLDNRNSIDIRLAETNHGAGGNGSMMHNKLAIINGDMTFSGAGHYTRAALQNNWENFYFVSNKKTISNYSTYFKWLWDNSVDVEHVQSVAKKLKTGMGEIIASSKPATLNGKFTNNVIK